MYTEAQLNGKNKSQVVAIALNVIASLDSIANAPATPNAVKGAMINLKREIGLSKERTTISNNDFKLAKARLEEDNKRAIAELELKYASSTGEDQAKLLESFKALEERVGKAKADLTFGLEVAQNDLNDKMEEINGQLAKAKENHDNTLEGYKETSKLAKDNTIAEIKSIETTHGRKVEQLLYDNGLAIRDKNEEYLEDACKKLSLSTVGIEELQALKDFEATDEKDIISRIGEAESDARAKVHQSEGAKYGSLKSSSDNNASLAALTIKNLEGNLSAANSRITDLEGRLKDVPAQIASAVEAAKSSVTVSQDAGKK